MSGITKIINSGVPVLTPICIYWDDLLSICKDEAKLNEVIRKNKEAFDSFVNNTIGMCEMSFARDILTLCSNEETLEKVITFFSNIPCILQCSSYDEYEARLEELRNIKSKESLKKKFPLIYQAYDYYLTRNLLYEDYQSLMRKRHITNRRDTIAFQQQFTKTVSEKLGVPESFVYSAINSKRYDRKMTFYEYIDDCVKKIIAFDENEDSIDSFCVKNGIGFDDTLFDLDKFELYIAHRFMCEMERFNGQNSENFVSYLTDYFKTDRTRKDNDSLSIEVEIDDSDNHINKRKQVITPKSLYERYKRFLRNNPDAKVVDFSQVSFAGMTLKEVTDFYSAYMKDLELNWELLPEDRDLQDKIIDRRVTSGIKRTTSDVSEEEKKEKESKLLDLYIEKKTFYGSTSYLYSFVGKNTFDGYVGYAYPNGKVILDKYYEDKSRGKYADSEAIYIMDIKDFYVLSHYSKAELIKHPRVIRKYHRRDWQGRLADIINSQSGSINAETVKKLVLSNQRDGENKK